jgi:hypothetical protein
MQVAPFSGANIPVKEIVLVVLIEHRETYLAVIAFPGTILAGPDFFFLVLAFSGSIGCSLGMLAGAAAVVLMADDTVSMGGVPPTRIAGEVTLADGAMMGERRGPTLVGVLAGATAVVSMVVDAVLVGGASPTIIAGEVTLTDGATVGERMEPTLVGMLMLANGALMGERWGPTLMGALMLAKSVSIGWGMSMASMQSGNEGTFARGSTVSH